MKILITGDRNWVDEETITNTLLELGFDYPTDGHEAHFNDEITLIEGDARGADRIAGHVARTFGWEVIEVPAKWSSFGKAAGPIRNQQMLDMNPDVVVAFHSNLESSKGTKDMVDRAKRKGVKVILIDGKE